MRKIFARATGSQEPGASIHNLVEQGRRWRRFLWLLVPATIFVILMTVVLQDLVRQVILVPAAYVAWLGGLILKSTPDILLWSWLILMVIILALRSLSTGRDRRFHQEEPRLYRSRRERLAFWLLQIQLADSEYARLRLVDFLGKLVTGVLSYRERMLPAQIEQRLRSGDLEIPPEVALFVKEKASPEANRSRRLLERMWASLGTIFRSVIRPGRRSVSFEHDLLRLVEFLEKQLDIKPGESPIAGLPRPGSNTGTYTQPEKD